MRSNFDGSDKEMIVPPTGWFIFTLAIHEPSGNVYFSVKYSNEIIVCNALGENCSVVVYSSSLANEPHSLALDYKNNVMYWTNNMYDGASLIRANLDGSNVTMVSYGLTTSKIAAITLVQPSNNTLYWAGADDDTIGTIDVNGGNKRTLVKLKGFPGPHGIQVDAQKIYFCNMNINGRNVQSIDRDSGQGLTTIFNSNSGIGNLALFSAPA